MRRWSVLLAFALPIMTLAACSDSDSPTEPETSDIDIMKDASAAYHDIQAALAAGFIPLSECVEGPAGGMGFHYGHPARIEDAVIDPALPEILLYAPKSDGGMELVGVEFMVHEGAWHGAGNTAAPSVAGQAFDAPNPNHPDEHLREMYTLHAWVWKDNPSGMFAPFNPTVTCDE